MVDGNINSVTESYYMELSYGFILLNILLQEEVNDYLMITKNSRMFQFILRSNI